MSSYKINAPGGVEFGEGTSGTSGTSGVNGFALTLVDTISRGRANAKEGSLLYNRADKNI